MLDFWERGSDVAGAGEGNGGGRVDDMIICLMKPFEIFGVAMLLQLKTARSA